MVKLPSLEPKLYCFSAVQSHSLSLKASKTFCRLFIIEFSSLLDEAWGWGGVVVLIRQKANIGEDPPLAGDAMKCSNVKSSIFLEKFWFVRYYGLRSTNLRLISLFEALGLPSPYWTSILCRTNVEKNSCRTYRIRTFHPTPTPRCSRTSNLKVTPFTANPSRSSNVSFNLKFENAKEREKINTFVWAKSTTTRISVCFEQFSVFKNIFRTHCWIVIHHQIDQFFTI